VAASRFVAGTRRSDSQLARARPAYRTGSAGEDPMNADLV